MTDALQHPSPGHATVPPPDDQTAVSVGVNGFAVNGNDASHGISPDCVAVDSPATPVSNNPVPDLKIDLEYQEQESDARHEPVPIKSIAPLDKLEDASIIPEVGTPSDPSILAIHPPQGTPPPPAGQLLEDVRMAEETEAPEVLEMTGEIANDVTKEEDVVMEEPQVQTPNGMLHVASSPNGVHTTPSPNDVHATSSSATIESNGVSTSYTTPNVNSPDNNDDEDKPPPAKRARKYSDADKASLAHSATPPPASVSPAFPPPDTPASPPPSTGVPTLSNAQFRFCLSTVRQLKKLKDAAPFLLPVDPVALNIPHYPSIIKTPMDFSTVERKLNSSNPAKPDANPSNPHYRHADEFIADIRLIFSNCVTFNGPDHIITLQGKRLEAVFDKQVKNMPSPAEPKPVVVKKVATPPPPPPPVAPKKTNPARRPSTSVPVIRRSDTELIGRPKREIHPPPPKDLPYADAPKKHRKSKRVKDDGTEEQLKFCAKVLQDLHRKQHYAIANPFYEPVDWVKLDIPSYPKIIKKPMDLSTMKKKLDNHEYLTAQKFYDDFKLMIRNCFTFNPAGTAVNQAGIELQRLFDDKWKNLPSLHDVSDDDEDDEEEDSDEDRARTIAMMESQIETMRGSIAALKSSKAPKEKKEKRKRDKAPVASTSKVSSKQLKVPSKKKGKKPIADDDVLTFEQKKDLSESIGKLDGTKLEKVIQIIHEGVPEIRDSTEEIELEIDLLPAAVLTKLYNFVLRPLRSTAPKRNRPGKGTGTGGLKRKSMDEDAEAEKIRQLEERMALFGASAGTAPARREDLSEHSSDSSSGSDSSGSDSE